MFKLFATTALAAFLSVSGVSAQLQTRPTDSVGCRVGKRFFREQSFLLPFQHGKEYACLRSSLDLTGREKSGSLDLMLGDNFFCDREFTATVPMFAMLKESYRNRIIFTAAEGTKDIQLRMWESGSVTDLEIIPQEKKYVINYDLVFPSCPDVDYVGNPCNEDGGTCDMCQGDCDSDSDCTGDLRCVQRYGYDGKYQVPGCFWPNRSNYIRKDNDDFCFMPVSRPGVVNYVGECGDENYLCNECEGDCDDDDDCEGDLVCFKRNSSDGFQAVPSCSGEGGDRDVYSKDICIDPINHPNATSF